MEKEKSKKIIIAVCALAVVCLCVVSFSFGKKIKVDEEAVSEYAHSLEMKSEEYQKLKKEVDDVTAELSGQKDLLNEFNTYKTERSEKTAELETLKNDITLKESELNDLKAQCEAKTAELNELKGEIVIAKSEKIISAGYYTVGTDIESGTYDVQWVSGQGNFFVRGKNDVNEIFSGRDDFGIREYKNMKISTGDEVEIKSSLKVKLILK